jgi:hypothetical protein
METPNLFELSVDGASSGFLKETSRWAKFLSIVGFVMVGLMILISLSIIGLGSSNALLEASFQNAGYSSPMMVGVIYLVMAVVSIFPYLYLFQFGSRMKAALDASDQDALNSAFSSLKSCFKFVGVFTIIMLAFLILAFAVMIVVAVTGGV